MKKRRKSNNTLNALTILFLQCAIILATVAILFGGIFSYLGNSPPETLENKIEQTIEYENQTDVNIPENFSNTVISEDSSKVTNSEQENFEEPTLNTTFPENSAEIYEDFPESELSSEPIGTIYLTFDDGPSTQITTQILDILKEKNVKATFFILDYSYGSEKESLVIREIEEGHTVGLHGISHDYSKIYTSLQNLIDNFTELQEKIKNSTGYTPKIIRFPGGSSNTVSKKYCSGIMTEAVEYFSNSEFIYFDWNVDSRDAGGVNSSQEVYENVINNLKEGRNNVVLMHDSSNKEYTLNALETIIDFCINAGYEFKALSEETPQVKHNVSN